MTPSRGATRSLSIGPATSEGHRRDHRPRAALQDPATAPKDRQATPRFASRLPEPTPPPCPPGGILSRRYPRTRPGPVREATVAAITRTSAAGRFVAIGFVVLKRVLSNLVAADLEVFGHPADRQAFREALVSDNMDPTHPWRLFLRQPGDPASSMVPDLVFGVDQFLSGEWTNITRRTTRPSRASSP